MGDIIGAYKSITTDIYIDMVKNNQMPAFDKRIWQRNYYEHIIRNEDEYERTKKYILNNPSMWNEDVENQ